MSNILYTETNFLFSYATGRNITTDRLISAPPPAIRIAIPAFCFMEALSVLEAERKRQTRFINDLESEITQAGRNLVSPKAHKLINHLQASLIEFQSISSDFETRLFRAISILSAHAVMIESTSSAIQSSLARNIISDPTDNLILASIVSHASAHPTDTKAFLTENRRCFFDNRYAKGALESVHVKCFADASNCLDWFENRSMP